MTNRKKTRRLRGSRTHGWGAGKKHRGAGHRGGRGNAGSGKRGQQKVTKYLSKGTRGIGLGRRIKPKSKINSVINVGELAKKIKTWEAKGVLKKEKDVLVINLTKLGYDKLLGYGDTKDIKRKIKVIINKISESASKKLSISAPKETKAGKGQESKAKGGTLSEEQLRGEAK